MVDSLKGETRCGISPLYLYLPVREIEVSSTHGCSGDGYHIIMGRTRLSTSRLRELRPAVNVGTESERW